VVRKMLRKIEINNINSIKKTIIDFEKGKYKYLDEMIYNDVLVNPIAFYGYNGSGKTSFLYAINSLVSLMVDDPDELRSFESNRLLYREYLNILKQVSSNKNDTSKIEEYLISYIKLYFTLDDIDYSYFISTTFLSGIEEEYLISGEKKLFYRKRNRYKRESTKKIRIDSTHFPLLRKLALETTDRTDQISKVYSYISGFAYIAADRKQYSVKALKQKGYRDLMVEKSESVKKILKDYEAFPIYEVVKEDIVKDNIDGPRYFFNLDVDGKFIKLPLGLMSAGMLNHSFLLSVLLTLPDNGVLIVDEIEQALHPSTIRSFFEIVRKKKIQLIFSSHNTYILQMLRPDQIFFANWKHGFSEFKKLSNIYPNIREVNNIEKMYLSSMFDDEIENYE